jgi:ElaB/YqjD/DUF883 family membrane-anchored ribosome-binding protein
VLIGADSAMTSAAGQQRTVQEVGVIKVETHFGELFSATTGAVGLSQRFRYELEQMLQGQELKKYQSKSPIRYATDISQRTLENFKKTLSPQQQHPQIGIGLGALVGFVCNSKAHLAEFDQMQFHPELKGLTNADGRPTTRPYVTMGSGQILADPFIAHMSDLLFGGGIPRLSEGRLLVAWTLQHVLRFNTGGVGGEMQIQALEKVNGKWTTNAVDVGETAQQVADIEKYVSHYWESIAQASAPDLGKQLSIPPASAASG